MYLKPRVKAPAVELLNKTASILKKYDTNTICMESACPNIAECFSRGTATFLILGDICTRKCHFCNVTHGRPEEVNESEIYQIAAAIKEMGLKYVVITSVDRDDLSDLGASHFAKICKHLKSYTKAKVELLTPDFQARFGLLDMIIEASPHKLAHNIETVERLSKSIMPGCSYKKSLKVLEYYAKSGILTKSSIMLGLGESEIEIEQTFQDLLNAGVRQLTIGQYLSPSSTHAPVKRYYTPKEFDALGNLAKSMGFEAVTSGVLVRSSYYAERF